MPWYDIFAHFYDHTVELVYRSYRQKIVEGLKLQPGDMVMDLACGTGPNQPWIREAVGPEGRIFGVDFSAGMLAQATKQKKQNGWENVFLLERDARKLLHRDLEEVSGKPVQLNAILVTLGLSAIPDWETVFQNTFQLLAPHGRYVIFDIHQERWVPQSWVVKKIAQADLLRQSWIALENCSENFSFEYLSGSPHIHGGRPFLAIGSRPEKKEGKNQQD
jgi:demethylmenaquinone methyltransferase/2-methoxy-6-polyprenyl-1,4-benzoquinol methylase